MTNCKSTSHCFDISLCFNSLTKEKADNKWEDKQWSFDEPKTQIYIAPMLIVLEKTAIRSGAWYWYVPRDLCLVMQHTLEDILWSDDQVSNYKKLHGIVDTL